MKVVKRRYNKLIGKSATQQMLDAGIHEQGRRQGTTTATALRVIATAIQNPGLTIEYQDHHPTRGANDHLRRTIRECIVLLDLKYIRVSPRDYTVCFDLWDTGDFIIDRDEGDDKDG